MEYNELLEHAEQENVPIIEDYDFSGTRIKGIYCDGVIALDKNIKTQKEKKCILAEELGHHYTASGNILDQSSVSNRKQELCGRIYAYNKLIGLMGIIKAYQHNCQSFSETAEYLDVTEEFLADALNYYRAKYGKGIRIDNYMIYFEPYLGVFEMI